MVSTGKCNAAASTDAAATAISMPGQCGRARRSPKITAMDKSATPTAAGVMLPRAAHSACSFNKISPGSAPGRASPNRSLIWLAKMISPIPAVKPTVTG